MRNPFTSITGRLFSAAVLFFALQTARAAEGGSDYNITPQDTIVVQVVGEPELSKEFRVEKSGTIRYPYIGNIDVAGKTTAEVETKLIELLDKDYIVNPQVTVLVKEYRVREVLVMGPVNKPGSIVLPGESKLTILDALGRAGGLSRQANENKIKFTRGKVERTFSLDQLKRETDPSKVIQLEPGDVIEVVDRVF